jgi:hypothetical protein
MALIPKYHSVVGQYPLDPSDISAVNGGTNTNAIIQGMVVGLSTSGYVKVASGSGGGSSTVAPLGLAADTLHSSRGYNAYSDSLVVNSAGSRKYTQNRVSDYFNETLGSGLMTVYLVGGEFYTDQVSASAVLTPGISLYAELSGSTSAGTGLVTHSSAASNVKVGVTTTGLINYPSGVPGVDGGSASDYSMPLATRFVGFILSV